MSAALTVIGAGGHAKVVVGLLHASGIPVHACFDDDAARWGSRVLGVEVRGPISTVAPGAVAVLAIGNNSARHAYATLPLRWTTLVHPRAFVDPSVHLGPGTVVFAGAVIQPEARLGAHVIVNTGACIDHDCVLGDCSHVAPGVHLAGAVTIREGAFLGVGAAVIPGRTVGAWATVGAGAAVVRDVEPKTTVVGVPARPVAARRGR